MVARSQKPLTSSLTFVVALAVLGVLILCVPAGAAAASSEAQVRKHVRNTGGRSGVYVYDITSGKLIAAKNPGVKRILASNAKLFTAAAALERHGAGGTLKTALWTDGTVENGVLNGNLYLRGGGDPLFGSTDYVKKYFGSSATAEQLALNTRLTGLTEISGRVFADETAFDSRRGTAPYGFSRSWEIGGQLSALIFNKGLTAGKFQNDPPRFAATKMRSALKAAGVTIGSGTGVKATPVGARRVAFVSSLPMSQLVRQMGKPSNNYLAEMLIKGLALPQPADGADSGGTAVPAGAAPATTQDGAGSARRFAAGLGSRVSLGDGSGLSRADLAAPREVVDLLRGMTGKATFGPFNLAFPIPGVDGTLYKRMRGTEASKRCHAKTGTLSNVSTLSGICTTASGHQIAFSILQNKVYPSGAHGIQDKIVTTVARLP